ACQNKHRAGDVARSGLPSPHGAARLVVPHLEPDDPAERIGGEAQLVPGLLEFGRGHPSSAYRARWSRAASLVRKSWHPPSVSSTAHWVLELFGASATHIITCGRTRRSPSKNRGAGVAIVSSLTP